MTDPQATGDAPPPKGSPSSPMENEEAGGAQFSADPVDGGQVLHEIVHMVRRYVVLTAAQVDGVALWIVHAHAHDAAQVSPLLLVSSPEKGSGKSTLKTVIGRLVPNPVGGVDPTGPAIFMAREGDTPTFLIDETDAFLKRRPELRGVINSGHHRGDAYVLRAPKGPLNSARHTTWSPKALFGIGANEMHGTLLDRSIIIEMRRRLPSEHAERTRLDRLEKECEPIRRRAARWVADHIEGLREA